MTVLEIILKYLNDNNFDGLCNPKMECGCSKQDIAPCGAEGIIECKPAYKCDCDGCEDYNECYTTSPNRECWKGRDE